MKRLVIVVCCMCLNLLGTSAWGIGFDSSSNYFDASTHAWGFTWDDMATAEFVHDRQPGADAVSEMDWTHQTVPISYQGRASHYDLRGKLSNGSDTTHEYNARGESAFWDEIYFETETGDPAELVFNFNIHVDFSMPDGYIADENYWFDVTFGTQRVDENGDPIWDSGRPLGIGIQTENIFDDFDGLLSFSTLNNPFHDLYNGELVKSGTYFPIYFSTAAHIIAPTNALVASIDWLNTFQLDSIDAYLIDDQGERVRKLSSDEYTLYSTSQSIPEPATLTLIGLGLAGIGYRRHRSKKVA